MRAAVALAALILLLPGCATPAARDCRPAASASLELPGADYLRLVQAARATPGFAVDAVTPAPGLPFSSSQLDRVWSGYVLDAVSWIPDVTPSGQRDVAADVFSIVARDGKVQMVVTTAADRNMDWLRLRLDEFARSIGVDPAEARAWLANATRTQGGSFAPGPDGKLRAITQEFWAPAAGTFRFPELYANASDTYRTSPGGYPIRGTSDAYGAREHAFGPWTFELVVPRAHVTRASGSATLDLSLTGDGRDSATVRGNVSVAEAASVVAAAGETLGFPAPPIAAYAQDLAPCAHGPRGD